LAPASTNESWGDFAADGGTPPALLRKAGGATVDVSPSACRRSGRPNLAPPPERKRGAEGGSPARGRSQGSTRSPSLEPGRSHTAEERPSARASEERFREAIAWLTENASKDAAVAEQARRMGDRVTEHVLGLRSQLESDSELIRHLKTVVKAQHAKIEDLRDPAWSPYSPNLGSLTPASARDKDQDTRDEVAAELKAQVLRLGQQVRELKASNLQLRRVNRRHAAMLEQFGEAPASAPAESSDTVSAPPVGVCDSASAPAEASAAEPSSPPPAAREVPRHRASCVAVSNVASVPPDVPMRRKTVSHAVTFAPMASTASGSPRGPSSGQRLAQASRSAILALWRDPEPAHILRSLLHNASKILEGHKSTVLTLYVIDSWLRRTMADGSLKAGGEVYSTFATQLANSTMYYLKGKVAMHAIRRDGAKPEAPRFTELSQLPALGSANFAALPVSSISGRGRPFAVLQITLNAQQAAANESDGFSSDEDSRSLSMVAAQSTGVVGGGSGMLGLTGSQVSALQLTCATAAGILDMRRRMDVIHWLVDRSQSCLGIVEEAGRANSVCDFESRAKPLIAKFFNVARVRFSFYDQERRELLTTTIQGQKREGGAEKQGGASDVPAVGRRRVQRFASGEGVVGKCARSQTMVHIERIRACPFISQAADGVDLADGIAECNMLAVPMIARFGDGRAEVMGVVQLMHKQKRSADDPLSSLTGESGKAQPVSGEALPFVSKAAQAALSHSAICDGFTNEDEDFLSRLSGPLSLVLWKTIQAQKAGTEMSSMERLLLAA